jgi:hypothetical protein
MAQGAREACPVLDSVRYLGGRELDEPMLVDLAWRLAGNVARLRAGHACQPWARQTEVEWVPAQITGTRYAIKKRPGQRFGQSGRAVRLRFLAGTPCGLTVEQFWSNEKADVIADSLGFARKPPYHKAHHAELGSMRLMALVEPARSQREPGFHHVACPPAFKAYNRRLIRMRRRIGFACPEQFEHECSACPRGARACPAACHPTDFVLKPCPGCGRADQWFDTDPGFVNDYCVHCQPLASAGIPLKVLAAAPPPEAP